MYSFITNSVKIAMETRNHSKNGVNPKNHKSKENFKKSDKGTDIKLIIKKNVYLLVIAIVTIFATSCEDKEIKVQDNNKEINFQKSTEINLIDYINNILSENKINYRAFEITSVGGETNENYEIQTINFVDNEKRERQFAFYRILYKTDNMSNESEVVKYQVFCTGDCGCKIEGKWSPETGYYAECSCNDCSMVYVIKDTKSLFFGDKTFEFNFEKTLKELDKKYIVGNNIKITSIRHIPTEENLFIFFNYENTTLGYNNSFVISYAKAANTSYTITCDPVANGSCTECYERFYPPNCIECSCKDCKMTITTNEEMKQSEQSIFPIQIK